MSNDIIDDTPGIDPFALANALRGASERHGASFVDTSEALRQLEKPKLLYDQVDDHLSGAGLPIVTSFIADKLASASPATFANCHINHTSKALAQ